MTSQSNAAYRVVQWATGNVGSRALRRAIEHPELELVGVYVHSADKAGRDAGDLCGIAPTGVKATNSIDDIIALKPDCVLYMPQDTSYDEVCRLLESGINIVTTRGDFHHPGSMEPEERERVEAACLQGGASIHSTGSSPGFVSEALPLVLASLERSLNSLRIYEYADVSSRDSPAMLFETMGFGKQPGGSYQAFADYVKDSFGPSLNLIAEAVGLPLDELQATGTAGLARKDTHIAAGLVPAGTVAALRNTVSGLRGGKTILSFTATWYVSTDVDTENGETWEFPSSPSGWRILVDGDCPLDVTINFPVAPENYADFTPGLTAHRPVNAIPYVCAAAPGICTTIDLPQIVARFGAGRPPGLQTPAPQKKPANGLLGFLGFGKKAKKTPAAPQICSTANMKIGVFLSDPAARALLDQHFPGVSSDSRIGMAKSMTLRKMQKYAADVFTNEALDALDKDLAQLPPR